MAIGHHIRHRKARKPTRLGRLNNADIGNVVRDQAVKFDAQLCVTAAVVTVQNSPRNGSFFSAVAAADRSSALPDGFVFDELHIPLAAFFLSQRQYNSCSQNAQDVMQVFLSNLQFSKK